MKTINLILYNDRISPEGIFDGGVQGDDSVTQIIAVMDETLVPTVSADEQLKVRVEAVNGSGEFYSSEFLPIDNNTVVFSIPREISSGGGLATLNFVCSVMKNGVQKRVKYSQQIRVKFKTSAEYYGSQYLNSMSSALEELYNYREWLKKLDPNDVVAEKIVRVEQKIAELETALQNYSSEMTSLLENKVDKQNNKGLSTNDYTNADKELVQTITNKANTNDVNDALENKVDKIPGKGLSTNDYTSIDKMMVDTISGKANVITVNEQLANKQDKLIAGRNVTIEGNVISTSGGEGGVVDQTYNPISTNAQSGTAVEQGISSIRSKANNALDMLGEVPEDTTVQAEIEQKSDKTTIIASSDTTAIIELLNNNEYRYANALSNLTITFPTEIPNDYITSVVFNSAGTPTNLAYPSSIKWSGNDIVSEEFVPVSGKKYTLCLWYDGVMNGVVRGVSNA